MTVREPWRRVDGLLLLDKPHGLSSNVALQKARRLFRAEKAGHTGTLDPYATGLLPVCFGEATKFSAFLLDAPKAYLATLRLGAVSSTQDGEGEITPATPFTGDDASVDAVLAGLLGPGVQQPPMHSALKFQGKALYHYARAGIEVAREPRAIDIQELRRVSLAGDLLTVQVRCSKGTYIRVLAEEIGSRLGSGAYLADLRRTATGGFQLAQAITLDALEALSEDGRRLCLLAPDRLVEGLPPLELDPLRALALVQGQPVTGLKEGPAGQRRIYDADQRFLGVGELAEGGRLLPMRLMADGPRQAAATPRSAVS